MMDTIRSFLSDYSFEVDDRQPQFVVMLPYIGNVSFTNISLVFWVQAFLLLSFQSVINIGVAVVVYTTIVKQQRTIQAYLIGYGIVCPLLLYLPFYLIQMLELKNVAFMLCLTGAVPNLLLLRVVEAMHDMLPSFAGKSLGNFVLYYSATLQFQFDDNGKPKTMTRTIFVHKVWEFLKVFALTSLLYSLLLPFDYDVFPSREIASLLDLYYWGNLFNAFLMASLTSVVLEGGELMRKNGINPMDLADNLIPTFFSSSSSTFALGATGMGLLTSMLTGIQMMTFSDSPLTKSSSPSDFWGDRWDKPVASALRRGVFRPLRQAGISRHVSALLTFCMSGMIHEYILVIMAQRKGIPNNPSHQPYVPAFGQHTLFFIWNGIVLLLERTVESHPAIQWIQSNVPKQIRTMLVLLTVLPIARTFTDEYVASNFYSDAAFGFPLITYLGS
jgi:hypothetical protein